MHAARQFGHGWHLGFAATQHSLHHLAHLLELAHELVDLLYTHTGPSGNTRAAAAIEDIGITALGHGHGVDDGLGARHLLFRHGAVHFGQLFTQAAQPRDKFEDAVQRAELFHPPHLGAKIFQVKAGLAHLLGKGLRFFGIDGLLRALHQRQHVAHTEDASGDTVRMEDLHLRQLFPHTHKFDRRAGDGLDGEGRAAASVAVHLGQHHAADAEPLVEGFGHGDRILAGHGVGHKKDLLRLHGGLDGGKLLHEGLIHMQAARRIQQHYRGLLRPCFGQRGFGDIHRIHVHRGGVTRHVELPGQHGQLIDGGGAVHVRRHKVRTHLPLAQQIGQLARRGGLARALQAHEHDDRRFFALQIKVGRFPPQQLHQLVMYDLDDLLGGAHALEDFLPEAFGAYAVHKVLDDLEVDVRLKQGKPNLAQARLHVFLGQVRLAPQVAERGRKTVGKALEHGHL